jgi:hypothetical protein
MLKSVEKEKFFSVSQNYGKRKTAQNFSLVQCVIYHSRVGGKGIDMLRLVFHQAFPEFARSSLPETMYCQDAKTKSGEGVKNVANIL